MPADMQKLLRDKELILSSINSKGPSLPVHVAGAANLSILFASAFLSELYAEGKVKMSHMKVGSSSLYFTLGQEAQLENFVEYLNPKEKEAFYLLKKEKVLFDNTQTPAIRVALRAIKDFAIPVNVKVDNEPKIFWKYFLIQDAEVNTLINEYFSPAAEKKEEQKSEEKEKQAEAKITEKKQAVKQEKTSPEEAKTQKQHLKPIALEKENKTFIKPKKEESNFVKEVKTYIKEKDIEVLSSIEKSKELTAVIKIDSLFGAQEYCLIAKDKKKITENDVILAFQKAQTEKMPAVILSQGNLDKKAIIKISELKSLVKFKKLNNNF